MSEQVGDDAAVPTGKWLSSIVDDSVVSEQVGENAAVPTGEWLSSVGPRSRIPSSV